MEPIPIHRYATAHRLLREIPQLAVTEPANRLEPPLILVPISLLFRRTM